MCENFHVIAPYPQSVSFLISLTQQEHYPFSIPKVWLFTPCTLLLSTGACARTRRQRVRPGVQTTQNLAMGGSARRKVMEDWSPEFWDNLSKVYISLRSLREFERRTIHPPKPRLPSRRELDDHQLLRLKRFARHGGPCLDDLHASESSLPSMALLTFSVRRGNKSEHGASKLFGV